MMDTLTRLMDFYGKDTRSKSIIWAHSTRIGDARYTDMAKVNMVNLGQLVRQQAPASWFWDTPRNCYCSKGVG
jgi:erythromycin esterase-like protein